MPASRGPPGAVVALTRKTFAVADPLTPDGLVRSPGAGWMAPGGGTAGERHRRQGVAEATDLAVDLGAPASRVVCSVAGRGIRGETAVHQPARRLRQRQLGVPTAALD